MPRPRVYKLTHSFEKIDSKIYFKTTMKDDFLIKLIKIWQLKLTDIVPEYDWELEDMMVLLETFGCKRISEDDGFRTYYEANLYDIWEYENTWWPEEDWVKPEFNNPNTDNIFQRVLQKNRENLSDVWEKWEEEHRRRKNEA